MGLLHVTDAYLCSSTLVYGPSMLPTLNISGDVLLSEHVSHRFGKVGAGDLVLVRSPNDPRKIVTKRILGMEGDQVTFFVDPKHSDRSRTTVVPKGHVWIQGDNIYSSFDSRTYGAVPYGLIQGKVCGHLMALDHWIDEHKEDYNIKVQTAYWVNKLLKLCWNVSSPKGLTSFIKCSGFIEVKYEGKK
ncbi:hypothetical protein GBA52_013618 [Prunus armeniaca]|nr:hypothetical protein GBA52_013618 [Prunus armeniaca]